MYMYTTQKSTWKPESKTIIFMKILFSFPGPKHDADPAKQFIAKMYINVNEERSADIYPHFTCATDTENIRFVFEVVRNHILQQHIVEVIPGLWNKLYTTLYTTLCNATTVSKFIN